jgi:hypothetical protein
MANGFIVTKEDWENMTPEQQGWMTFNAVQSMDARLCKLENKKWVNSGCAVIGGAIGGFLFSLFKLLGVK